MRGQCGHRMAAMEMQEEKHVRFCAFENWIGRVMMRFLAYRSLLGMAWSIVSLAVLRCICRRDMDLSASD